MTIDDDDFDMELEELSTAEDFLDYFGVVYDPSVVHVNRLHILQRFHDYMSGVKIPQGDTAACRALYAENLVRAYQDFVESDAVTEKVFKVFKDQEAKSKSSFVPLTTISIAG
jgi:nitrogenase-stabilizing/protective protein